MTVNMDILHRQIDALERKSLSELQAQFEELYGFVPGDTNAKNLRQRIAYRLQEIMLGGLSDADKALLDRIADADPLANLRPDTVRNDAMGRGVRYHRVWQGKEYEAVSLGKGRFEFNGQEYRSLSAVAKAITGKKWNGLLFFGVKSSK